MSINKGAIYGDSHTIEVDRGGEISQETFTIGDEQLEMVNAFL
jgi:hypothetical protein